MPAAPILILLPAPLAPPDAAGGAREQESERMILGLGLVRRAVLAARRAGYGQVFVLSARWRRDGRGGRCSWLEPFRREPDLLSRRAACHCACGDPGGDRLARTAGGGADRAGRLGGDPEPDRHGRGRIDLRRARCARGEGRRAGPDRGREQPRPPVRLAGGGSGRDRSDCRRDAGGRPPRRAAADAGAGQGHRRVHGPSRRAADLDCRSRASWRRPRSRPIR